MCGWLCCFRAWREGFTITLVSGRTVGIGAYLARLGRRCVQRLDQPIILTGFQALNKVLGKEVRSCTHACMGAAGTASSCISTSSSFSGIPRYTCRFSLLLESYPMY